MLRRLGYVDDKDDKYKVHGWRFPSSLFPVFFRENARFRTSYFSKRCMCCPDTRGHYFRFLRCHICLYLLQTRMLGLAQFAWRSLLCTACLAPAAGTTSNYKPEARAYLTSSKGKYSSHYFGSGEVRLTSLFVERDTMLTFMWVATCPSRIWSDASSKQYTRENQRNCDFRLSDLETRM